MNTVTTACELVDKSLQSLSYRQKKLYVSPVQLTVTFIPYTVH